MVQTLIYNPCPDRARRLKLAVAATNEKIVAAKEKLKIFFQYNINHIQKAEQSIQKSKRHISEIEIQQDQNKPSNPSPYPIYPDPHGSIEMPEHMRRAEIKKWREQRDRDSKTASSLSAKKSLNKMYTRPKTSTSKRELEKWREDRQKKLDDKVEERKKTLVKEKESQHKSQREWKIDFERREEMKKMKRALKLDEDRKLEQKRKKIARIRADTATRQLIRRQEKDIIKAEEDFKRRQNDPKRMRAKRRAIEAQRQATEEVMLQLRREGREVSRDPERIHLLTAAGKHRMVALVEGEDKTVPQVGLFYKQKPMRATPTWMK
ncbi:hypothetical protein ADUPG1_008232 [Aduncisulcus paluster]|uniref:Uncharacterized protein n=1 Tax=Aduncisulcus paluster TaxID=2918883 RepID=A0ABQ5KR76_9EUKA|nr:hypothetical protein ADUPG1_008232 [Aduncisulcus paluster]